MNTLTTTETMEIVDEGAISDTSSDLDSRASSPDGDYNESNLLSEAMENEVTSQLIAAGVVGVAAAAAIQSSKKRKRPHSFETNPSIRKRQQNRLLRKLRVSVVKLSVLLGDAELTQSRLFLSYLLSKRYSSMRLVSVSRPSF
jgi:nuclear respiratory factor 1